MDVFFWIVGAVVIIISICVIISGITDLIKHKKKCTKSKVSERR